MLTAEENQRLTRIGPGTEMGALFRQYWLPTLLSSELPEPDCAPVRVKLLGENLVAFRNSDGKVGLMDVRCPHRNASLFFGRNEENGLRCVYHGWKFDLEGRCVDMPSEPPESNFKNKVRNVAYPCSEAGGIVWSYMGSGEPPALPELEFTVVPTDHVFATKRYCENNWMQALEGDIDSSHAPFLHRSFDPEYYRRRSPGLAQKNVNMNKLGLQDTRPRLDAVETNYGLAIAARRDAGDNDYYWRLNLFFLPCFTMPPHAAGPDTSRRCHAWVPIDDETMMRYSIEWHPSKPLSKAHLDTIFGKGLGTSDPLEYVAGDPNRPGSEWLSVQNRDNDYLIDRQKQKTENFTGILGVSIQDQAVQESMGRISDRSRERLGTTDSGIIAARRLLLNAARALRENATPPPGVRNPQAYRAHSGLGVLPRGTPWTEGLHGWQVGV
ncbi:MAG: Rieske 2Fe-2S domain-containing protein [Burkholderiales bacterium]